jgi:hypothetical protein
MLRLDSLDSVEWTAATSVVRTNSTKLSVNPPCCIKAVRNYIANIRTRAKRHLVKNINLIGPGEHSKEVLSPALILEYAGSNTPFSRVKIEMFEVF